jgi:ribosomal protein L37AE/L43A
MLCQREGATNTSGYCRGCFNKNRLEELAKEKKLKDFQVKAKAGEYRCPICRKKTGQLIKIQELNIVGCKACTKKYKGKDVKKEVIARKEIAHMIVAECNLSRRSVPVKSVKVVRPKKVETKDDTKKRVLFEQKVKAKEIADKIKDAKIKEKLKANEQKALDKVIAAEVKRQDTLDSKQQMIKIKI